MLIQGLDILHGTIGTQDISSQEVHHFISDMEGDGKSILISGPQTTGCAEFYAERIVANYVVLPLHQAAN